MLVKELICNNKFDCNCNYEIYDCTKDGKQYGDGAEIIFDTKLNGYTKPPDNVLGMQIKYITTHENCIIIEAAKSNYIYTKIVLYFAVNAHNNYMYLAENKMHGFKDTNRLIDMISDKNALERSLNWNKLDDEHKPKGVGLYQAVVECEETEINYNLDIITCTPVCLI